MEKTKEQLLKESVDRFKYLVDYNFQPKGFGFGLEGNKDEEVKEKLLIKENETRFGELQPSGEVKHSMSIDLSKIKSNDPLAYAYGYQQAKGGKEMSQDDDLAPEYIRGFNDGKSGKQLYESKNIKKENVKSEN